MLYYLLVDSNVSPSFAASADDHAAIGSGDTLRTTFVGGSDSCCHGSIGSRSVGASIRTSSVPCVVLPVGTESLV